jgi:ATP-dependent Zn protease
LNFDENNYIHKDSKVYNYLYNNFNISNIIKWNKVSNNTHINNQSKISLEEIIVFFILLYIIIKISICFAGEYSLNNESKGKKNIINEEEEEEKKKKKRIMKVYFQKIMK